VPAPAEPEPVPVPEPEPVWPESVWPELVETARAFRIATHYHDWEGRPVEVSARTLIAALAAFDVVADSPESCRRALDEQRLAHLRPLPPCVILRQDPQPAAPHGVSAAGPAGAAGGHPVVVRETNRHRIVAHAPVGVPPTLWLALEDGSRRYDIALLHADPTELSGLSAYTFALPAALPIGWHKLYARIGDHVVESPLAVAPHRLEPAGHGQKGGRRAWGFTVQLHSVRSRRSWGMGDLGDLAELAAVAGHDLGAGFLVVNPLHGSSQVPPVDPSPYLPATRRFPDPVHLRIESVPEYAYAPDEVRTQIDALGADLRRQNLTGDLINRDEVWERKEQALRLLHATARTPGRSAAFRAFLAREGEPLRKYAAWLTLARLYGPDSTAWPEQVRRPITLEHGHGPDDPLASQQAEISFQCWLQWLLDEQLAAVRAACAHSGMTYGILHDLAVGAQAGGADVWADGDVYARGVTIGAPPDEFSQRGQDWSSRPWRPDRLAECGYLPYRQMLAGVLRHADGLRMDHVLGLFRLWWVPAGAGPAAGTYVSYDHDAMLAVLTLEAYRAGAVVIGEDLGTVEKGVREALADRGVLGTNVLWWERDDSGTPIRPERWRENCLAAVTTHDLPPVASLLTGAHLELRDRLGLLTRPLEQERAIDRANMKTWLDLLRRAGLLREGAGEQETVEALYRFLTWTPAKLVGVNLPDAVGDVRPHNLPGTDGETYPNWRLPLAGPTGRPMLLDDLAGDARVRSLARVLRTIA
jgi:4-alpha-glucanotransferase